MSPLDAAFYAGRELETVRRFADGCAHHLLANGRVVIIFSEDCDGEFIVSLFAERGLCLESKYVSRGLMERFHIVWFRAGARGAG